MFYTLFAQQSLLLLIPKNGQRGRAGVWGEEKDMHLATAFV
jgi:hypothetical protein